MHHNLSGSETSSTSNKGEASIWVLGNDKSITSKTIELGASDGVNVQVLSGVSENEKLVYSLKAISKSAGGPPGGGGSNESPFMPKPPGSKK